MNRMLVYDNRKQIEGIAVPMKLGENDTNDMQLILNSRVGELLVNGISVAALNLSENGDAGDVQVGTGFSMGDQAGTVVHYSNFAVSAPTAPSAFAQRADGLIYGPAVGILRHNPMGANIIQVFPNVALRDGTINARFFNPYATTRGVWDYGFQFRRSDTKLYRIVLFSDKSWKQYYAAKAASDMGFPSQSVTQVTSGVVAPLRTNAGDSNDVSLQIQGQTGTLRVNGARIADLDLGANTDEGAVSIATGFDKQLAGEATCYEEFTIAP